MRYFRTILLALGALLLTAEARAQDIGLPVGSKPAAVSIEDLEGAAFDLGSIVGRKPVVIEFWASWCPLCEALMPQMKAVQAKYGDRLDVVLIAVGVNQTPRSIRRHIAKHPQPGRVLWDGRGRATRAFMAPTTSYVVALDRAGRVVYTGAGEDQDLLAAAAKAVR